MAKRTTKPKRPVEAVILAAGKGTRMGGDKPKVLYPVADRPMIHWVVDACQAVGVRRNVIIVGHKAQEVEQELASSADCVFVPQEPQLGTGHAVLQAAPFYKDVKDADVFVLCGDGPLIRSSTLTKLLKVHRDSGASATLATAVIEDPTGYGRVVRDAAGRFVRIVEHKDATPEQLGIREINPSYYCFKVEELFVSLQKVTNKNAKGEYYLTDALTVLLSEGRTVSVVDAVSPSDVLSINTPAELEKVDGVLRQRLNLGVHA